MFSFMDKIYDIFTLIYKKMIGYLYPGNVYDIFIKNIMKRVWSRPIKGEKTDTIIKRKLRVGLLTNEIPPIVYGGVATWIINYMKMFESDENIEVVPIFLAYNDRLPNESRSLYKGIRIIEKEEEIGDCSFMVPSNVA